MFSVKFSLDDERRLTTCGTGHIRFWKLAATFTGLKLQGLIGKFGKAELSDIAAFVECPDGKVVSGTECGSLLLWEGNFIKCRFVRPGGESCHDGYITYVDLDREERKIITAGTDGYIRWWHFDTIDTAEVDSDNSIDFEIMPVVEYFLGVGRGVKLMVDGGIVGESRTFFIVDTTGCSRSIFFHLGEEPDEVIKPGLVKRRSIKDIVVANPTKRMRKLSSVLAAMKPEYKNLPGNIYRISECASPLEEDETKGEGDGDAQALDSPGIAALGVGGLNASEPMGQDLPKISVSTAGSAAERTDRSVRSGDDAMKGTDVVPMLLNREAFTAVRPVARENSSYHCGSITGNPHVIFIPHISLLCISLLSLGRYCVYLQFAMLE